MPRGEEYLRTHLSSETPLGNRRRILKGFPQGLVALDGLSQDCTMKNLPSISNCHPLADRAQFELFAHVFVRCPQRRSNSRNIRRR